jgi:hypothetical protein
LPKLAVSISQHVILGGVIGVAIWVGGYWALRRMRAAYFRSAMRSMPRAQSSAFESRLSKMAFANPFALMAALWSERRNEFVRGLWHEAGGTIRRQRPVTIELPGGVPAQIPPDRGDLPDDGISVHRLHLLDGRAIAVITAPPNPRRYEPLLLGIVLPSDPSLKNDLVRARRSVHFFVLNEGGIGDSSRTTDLCGWTADGKPLTYNCGAPRDVEGFARAIDAKLQELDALRAQRAVDAQKQAQRLQNHRKMGWPV